MGSNSITTLGLFFILHIPLLIYYRIPTLGLDFIDMMYVYKLKLQSNNLFELGGRKSLSRK